jgi:hypothetical protein
VILMSKFSRPILALFLIVAVNSACSKSAAPMSPTSATPLTSAAVIAEETSLSSADGARAQSAGVVAEWAANHGWAMLTDGLEVEGADVMTSVTGVCPTVVITVRGVPVTVNSATVFATGTTCAGLVAGARVAVRGVLTVTGTALSVVATRIGLEGATGTTPAPTGTKVAGTVTSILGKCPALIISLQGVVGNVITTATTVFDASGGCAAVAVGTEVTAFGTRNAVGYLIATHIEMNDDGEAGGGGGGGGGNGGGGKKVKVNGEGVIGSITGGCPTVTMVITGARVQTTATTEFINGSCTTLRSGTKVKVAAETQADGSYAAMRVEIVRSPGKPVAGDGKVDSVSGACPTMTMMVRGYTVRTSATTTFSGGTCASIGAGTHVDVTGVADETGVDATSVAIKR